MLRLDNSGPNFCAAIKTVIFVSFIKQIVQGTAEEVSFELNGHTVGFFPHTQKLEQQTRPFNILVIVFVIKPVQDSRAATTDKAKSGKRKITTGKEEERKTTQQCKFA